MELLMRDNLLNILTVPGNHNSNDAASVAEAGAAPAAVSRAGAGVPLPPPAITLAGPPTLSSSKNGGGGTEDGGCRRRGGGRLERCTILPTTLFPPNFCIYFIFCLYMVFFEFIRVFFSLPSCPLKCFCSLCEKKSSPQELASHLIPVYTGAVLHFGLFCCCGKKKNLRVCPKKERKELENPFVCVCSFPPQCHDNECALLFSLSCCAFVKVCLYINIFPSFCFLFFVNTECVHFSPSFLRFLLLSPPLPPKKRLPAPLLKTFWCQQRRAPLRVFPKRRRRRRSGCDY